MDKQIPLIITTILLFFVFSLTPNPAAASGEISVQGTTILRDGQPWVAKGVTVVGLIGPANRIGGPYAIAAKRWGSDELTAIKAYGADLIRFQVSPFALDPQSAIYTPDYANTVIQAGRMARAMGFAVIVSMQSGVQLFGITDHRGLPNDSTLRAWQQIAPQLSNDNGVIFELFNEPSKTRGDPSAPDPTWGDWLAAHQPLVDQIRKDGAHNVIMLDGLQWTQTLNGAPTAADPNVIYAVHPYAGPGQKLRSPAEWDAAFGNFAKMHAVLISEWNEISIDVHCTPDFPEIAANLLAYARVHNIGVVGWGFDFPGTLFKADGTLTSYNGFVCEKGVPYGKRATYGAGELIAQYFKEK